MSQSTSSVNILHDVRMKRRKIAARVIKNSRQSRGKPKNLKGRQRKVVQLIQEAQNEENTTNSDNSEGSPLYSEIDWEENLECDATLVDEFAPRIKPPPQPAPVITTPSNKSDDKVVDEPPSPQPQPNDVFDFLPLEEGAEIFVRVNLSNDNPKWLAAIVVEVDHEEEELLIRYTDGNPPPPMEWMNPNSNRISRVKPSIPPPREEGNFSQTSLVLPPKVEETVEVSKPELRPEVTEAVIEEATQPLVPSPAAATPPSPLPIVTPTPQDIPVSEVSSSLPSLTEIARRHRSLGGRTRASWKRSRAQIQPRTYHSGVSKFVEGEKVLAKWSDHRMQKFPAVIKTILNGGKYDVLFYDGFEKTISEEHLFKTTEEEVAKYEHMNPSEADSFVHMDLGSKEARRQRKKKTFDDYVFARDFKAKRRVLKTAERFNVTRKIFYSKSAALPVVEGEAKEVGEGLDGDKPHRQKKMRKRRRALFGPKKDTSRIKLHMLDLQRFSSTPAQEPEHFYGFDSVQAPVEVDVKPQTPLPPVIKPETPEPVVMKREPTEDRWKPNEQQEYKPIDINRDGVIRKSLVVPDNNLPPHWSKHAVVSTTSNIWDVILLSPDGYQISNAKELKQYFEMSPGGGPPPASLDFLADFNVLAELASKQKEISSAPTPKIWYRRRGRGGRRGGRGQMSGVRGRSGVRTLLPKYRFTATPPSSSSPPPSTHENEFRCPKEGCDKKFRKESLLQMHIKHYHSELSSLVRSVPNMVDLACARSESVNSDWTTSSDFPKVAPASVKKMLPRTFNSSPIVSEEPTPRMEQFPETPIPTQSTSRLPERTPSTESTSKKFQPNEERRSTIKTMLPIRPSEVPAKYVSNIDSDDVESEEDYIEQKKNGSRLFKTGKFRRGGRYLHASRGDENIIDSSYNQLPAFKLTKKRKIDKTQVSSDSCDAYPDEDKPPLNIEVTDEGVVIERLKSEEFINCVCGFREEDGLMIQCDICMCWQHGLCSGVENETDVPDRYVCNICRNPFRVRSSKKYAYAQHYLTQGKLPSFNFRARNDDEIAHKEMILKRCSEITASVLEIKSVDRSLAAKINIAEKADHPKLYMWAKNWEENDSKEEIKLPKEGTEADGSHDIGPQQIGPQPEAPIDLEECRIRLLDHVEHYYSQIEDRLTSLQTQIAALESLDPDLSTNSTSEKVIKQTIQMLIRDLETLHKLAAIS